MLKKKENKPKISELDESSEVFKWTIVIFIIVIIFAIIVKLIDWEQCLF